MSDFDGDIVFTTDNQTMVNNVFPDKNPITYEKNTAPVQRLTYSNMIKADTKTFNSKIGVITNFSTSFIAMLDRFATDKESPEYKELISRIKLLRRYIGDSIDSAKGIKMKPFPNNWKNRLQVFDTDSEEVKKEKYYHNSLVSNKKPYFMVYIYDRLQEDYGSFKYKFNQRCKIAIGCSLDVLMKRVPKSQSEKNFVRQYYTYMPVIKNHCIGNVLCAIIENNDFAVAKVKKHENYDRIIEILSDETVVKDNSRFKSVYALYKRYNSLIRNLMKLNSQSQESNSLSFYNDESEETSIAKREIYFGIKNEAEVICPNSKELATYATEIAYRMHPEKEKSFVWVICSDGLMQNIISHKSDNVQVPVSDIEGSEYLGKYYKLKEVNI